jgi:hypothetical protein
MLGVVRSPRNESAAMKSIVRDIYPPNETAELIRAIVLFSIEALCRKTLQGVNRDSEANPCPKISVKNYRSDTIGYGFTPSIVAETK